MVSICRLWTVGLFCLTLLFVLSCSGGGANPLAPSSIPGTDDSGLGLTSGPGDSSGDNSAQASQTGQSTQLWGLYELVYDFNTGQFEISPLRSAQFTFNMNAFLQPPDGNPANLHVTIKDASQLISAGLITLDVEITHPLNNPRIVGFDTFGILIGNGSVPYTEDEGVVFAGTGDLRLLNFDGYSRWMNPVEFTDPGFIGYTPGLLGTKNIDWTATANPYKYFADGLTPTGSVKDYLDANQATRGAFMPGTMNAREYQIQFPMVSGAPQVKFQYGIISHFRGAKIAGVPIPEPEISDFPPDANAPEAAYIAADTSESTLYFDEITTQGGGNLTINLTVYDWQGLAALGGNGAFGQIGGVGLDSPDGLFPLNGVTFDSGTLAGTEISTPGSFPTTIKLLIQGLAPQKLGMHELLIAVYSQDPDSYDQGFGVAFPDGARLAGYTRTFVEVKPPQVTTNNPPVIDEIQGPIEVSCWDDATVYTCIAHDPDAGDTLQYTYTRVEVGDPPVFINPMSSDNTATLDWTNEFDYPPGPYEIWFLVSDGELDNRAPMIVIKSSSGLFMHPITASNEDTNNVFCTNIDAEYTAFAESCDPDADVVYRFIRGFGDPPAHVPPDDPGWSSFNSNNIFTYSWDGTQIGSWWVIAEGFDGLGKIVTSPFYIVTRVDSPPSDVNPPSGETEVDCNNSSEVYILAGGEDCDGGENERQWTLNQDPTPPTGGWVQAVDDAFTVNWSYYPEGLYYAWQRVGSGGNWSISDPLPINRNNTPPYAPDPVTGPQLVDCSDTDAVYQAGDVNDCEGDDFDREWAIGVDLYPPIDGWTPFTGNSFSVDFSMVQSGILVIYQRATDNLTDWSYSDGSQVVKINSAPDTPADPIGPDAVSCYDSDALYEMGTVDDCDTGDTLTRSYIVSETPVAPIGEWTVFTGTSVSIDWSGFTSKQWYLIQKVDDGTQEVSSHSLTINKSNAPPEVDPPTGLTNVDCTSTDVEYTEGLISDCDPGSTFTKQYVLSTDPITPIGFPVPYTGDSFFLDFSNMASGDYYLYILVNDGVETSNSLPLHVIRHNSAPEKPDTPSGPAEITCLENPAIYDGGDIIDCDPFDSHLRFHYISTDPVTPTGGTWVQAIADPLIVEFDGVVAEQEYYLFQKISDGEFEATSDSFPFVYHNTLPSDPNPPTGLTTVSCSNDNEIYSGGDLHDCDDWQVLVRSWAINDADWPPAVGWTDSLESSWAVDWSQYDEGTFYMFQRAYDGFGYSYSTSLVVTVGPPTLYKPPIPIGPTELDCDGPVETYDASTYMTSCPGVIITREWAVNTFPTAPGGGWTEFAGTTFDVNPADLDFGAVYIFQRAILDAQTQTSTPLTVTVLPGALGTPDIPSGAVSVTCLSTHEDYQMGDIITACPDTPISRWWRIEQTNGTPVTEWAEFITSPVTINWTTYPVGVTYHLVQKVEDAIHTETSLPLEVDSLNTEPEFNSGLSGPTTVTCTDTNALYSGGNVDDCDTSQTPLREWALNTVDIFPVDGWVTMTGSSFNVDYSSPDILPGDIYLFQRVSDGIVTVYDLVSLHVTYNNTAPAKPAPPIGNSIIDCNNMQPTYNINPQPDCDGQTLMYDWSVNSNTTPPVANWTPITGSSFEVDWAGFNYGFWYLFVRASDGELDAVSNPLSIIIVNTQPEIASFACDEGTGPFVSDGSTPSLTGLDLINTLNFSFSVEDCDDDPIESFWAVTNNPFPLPQGDPSWTGPVVGETFSINLGDFTSMAPGIIFVQFSVSDGYNFSSVVWSGSVDMWKKLFVTDFTDVSDMWAEHACVSGSGSYTWNYDAVDEYLRLESYGAGSESAIWSEPVAFPAAPGGNATARLYSYLNPALAQGLDNVQFAFLDDVACTDYGLDILTGDGCEDDVPDLEEFTILPTAPIWSNTRRVGIFENGFDGCPTSEFYLDWVGIWVTPNH